MFQTIRIRITSFGFSDFGFYFDPGLFRSAGLLSIFGFRIFSVVSAKRPEAVASLVQDFGYRVSEVAEYLRRDQTNISTMYRDGHQV